MSDQIQAQAEQAQEPTIDELRELKEKYENLVKTNAGLDKKISEYQNKEKTWQEEREQFEKKTLDKDSLQIKIDTAKNESEKRELIRQLKERELDERLQKLEERDKEIAARENRISLTGAFKKYSEEKKYSTELDFNTIAELGEEKGRALIDSFNSILNKMKGINNSAPVATGGLDLTAEQLNQKIAEAYKKGKPEQALRYKALLQDLK